MEKCVEVNEFVKDRLFTYLKKDKDYGSSFIEGMKRFGGVSGIMRMIDKVNRFKQLYKTKSAVVEDEKIEDTLMDMFNYSMMIKSYEMNLFCIQIDDLVNNMYDEANILANYDVKSSYLYEYLLSIEVSKEDTMNIIEYSKKLVREYI